jgi:hypothetical protein
VPTVTPAANTDALALSFLLSWLVPSSDDERFTTAEEPQDLPADPFGLRDDG